MRMTSETLDGDYTETNEISSLIARGNVVIIRENAFSARSDEALFNGKENMVTLTRNPEIEQAGSILTADTIRIQLSNNQSFAEGQVRVRLKSSEPEGGRLPGL